MQITKYEIIDAQSKREWEDLIGIKIHAPYVRITGEFYIEHATEIQAIQMMAAFRHHNNGMNSD